MPVFSSYNGCKVCRVENLTNLLEFLGQYNEIGEDLQYYTVLYSSQYQRGTDFVKFTSSDKNKNTHIRRKNISKMKMVGKWNIIHNQNVRYSTEKKFVSKPTL